MTTTASATVVRKERDVVAAFERAGAMSVETAAPLTSLGVLEDGVAYRRLRAQGVVCEAAPGRFYLDREAWLAALRARRRLALIVFVSLVAGAAVVIWASRLW
jgi:hypothetical protein